MPLNRASAASTISVISLLISSASAELIWHSALNGNANPIIGVTPVLEGMEPVPALDINGNIGGALRFSGDSNPGYFEIVQDAMPMFTAGSISIWVRPEVVDSTEDGIVAVGATAGATGGDDQYFSMMNRSGGAVRVDLDDGSARLGLR